MQPLGKNIGGYFGERINIRAVLSQVEGAARSGGWAEEVFYQVDGLKWLALRKTSGAPERRVYISTGIHGDEPAGPLAALQLLQEDCWPANPSVTLLPVLNPRGCLLNRRESPEGIDLNRDYLASRSAEVRAHLAWLRPQPRFDLCFCLHEDWESRGFYVYELNPDQRPSLAETIIAAVQPVCPIDRSAVIEGRAAHGGIIRPETDPLARPLWPEAFWLLQHKTRLSYTLEAPSDFPLAVRVQALMAAVRAALA